MNDNTQQSNKQLEAMADYQTKLNDLEKAIRTNVCHQTGIKMDVEKVKSEIRSVLDSQKKLLSNREEELMRQVDVLASNETASLQIRNAELHYLLGHLVSHMGNVGDTSVSANAAKLNRELEILQITFTKSKSFLKFSADIEDLASTIQNFGHVESSGSIPLFPNIEESQSLPRKLEEYEDGENHLLHKSLKNADETKGVNSVTVNFPKLQQNSDWLRFKLDEGNNEPNQKYTKKLPGNTTQPIKSKHFSSVQTWLREINMDNEPEAACNSPTTLQQIMWPDNESQNDSSEESIVMLSPESNLSSFEDVKPIAPNNYAESDWLIKDLKICTPMKSYIPCCKNQSSSCCDNRDQAIEEIKKKSVSDLSMWLKKDVANTEVRKSIFPNVSKLCRANEPCKTFQQCLFPENCALTQNEKKSYPVENNKGMLLIQPMLQIMYGDQSWLAGPEKNRCKPAANDATDDRQRILAEKCTKAFDHLQNVNWLRTQVSPSTKNAQTEKLPSINFQCWEKTASDEINKNIQHRSHNMTAMFSHYFEPLDTSLWLRN